MHRPPPMADFFRNMGQPNEFTRRRSKVYSQPGLVGQRHEPHDQNACGPCYGPVHLIARFEAVQLERSRARGIRCHIRLRIDHHHVGKQ